MAFQHGKNATLKLGTSAITEYLDSTSMPQTVDLAEVTTYGDDYKQYITGLRDGTFSVSGPYSDELEAIVGPMFLGTSAIAIEYGPAGTTSGRAKWSGSARINQLDIQAPVGDKGMISIGLQLASDLTRGTF